jgi:hypothetical protein
MSAHLTAALLALAATSLSHAQCEPRWVPDVSPAGVGGPFPAGVGSAVYHDADGPGPLEPQLYVTGSFYLAGGTGADSVARWDGISWKRVRTTPETFGMHVSRFFSTRAHNRLLAVGSFKLDGSTDRTPLGIEVGDRWEPFDPQLRGSIWSLSESSDGVLHGLGQFNPADGTGPVSIMRLDRGGSVPIPCANDGTLSGIVAAPGGGLIAYGTFTRLENVEARNIALWNGASWAPLEAPGDASSPGQVVGATSMPDGSLVAAVRYTPPRANPVTIIETWDGASWAALGDHACRDVRALTAAPDGTVYIAGDEIQTGEQIGSVARWDGNRWSIIARYVESIDVYTLASLGKDSVFLGGAYRDVDGTVVRGAALWANRQWNPMGGDARYKAFGVYSVDGFGAISQGVLIDAPGGYSEILAQWTDAGWQPMDVPFPGYCVKFASNSNGDLLALRIVYLPTSVERCVIRWDGSDWVNLGTQLTGVPSHFEVLSDDRIVVTGDLTLDSTPCHVALWNGSSWSCIGAFEEGHVNTAAQMPDGTLVIGGSMRLNDTLNPTPLAAWIDEQWIDITAQQIIGSTYALDILPQGSLIAAGDLYPLSPELRGRNVFGWDGTSFADLGEGLEAGSTAPSHLLIDFDGMPVIAGIATETDVLNEQIVRWNGNAWEPLGGYHSKSGLLFHASRVGAIAVHTNGDILVTGMELRGVQSLGNRSSLCYSRSPAPRMAQSPLDLTINADEPIVLGAAVLMNLDEVTYQWYRNGVAINPGSGGASESGGFVSGARGTIAGRTDNSLYTLRITNATPGDAGSYTISFTNPCGTVVSRAATVTVRCIGDFNSDGGIDGSDVESFFFAWDEAATTADIDLDGLIDETDAREFFARWAEGRC